VTIRYYFNGGPNPLKVSLFLEEAGLDYEPVWIDILSGRQFDADFLHLNPNAKVPVIVDGDDVVFDSNAILLYLGVKHGLFVPEQGSPEWAQLLSWLMFVASGVGPYGGQAVHFQHAAPEEIPYAITRYLYEARRHFAILDARLADRPFLLGDVYSIADMALFGWAGFLPRVIGEDGAAAVPHLRAWYARVSERPAAQRALALPRRFSAGPPPQIRGNTTLFRHLA
jgi:GST-like protein